MQVDFVVVLVGAGMEMEAPTLFEFPEMVKIREIITKIRRTEVIHFI